MYFGTIADPMTEELLRKFIEELIPEFNVLVIKGPIIGPGASLIAPKRLTVYNEKDAQIGLISYNDHYLEISFTFEAKKDGVIGKRVFEGDAQFEFCDPDIRFKIASFLEKVGFSCLYDFYDIVN